MEIFFYLGNRDSTLQKQQVNKQQRALEPIRQTAHGELVSLARFELKLHNQIKRVLAFILFG